MSNEPRDPALAAMFRATVRVGAGSGVVVRSGKIAVVATAHHVVKGAGPHRIRWPEGFLDTTVLSYDESSDVAILASPPALEGDALSVAEGDDEATTGDDVWATGFPLGWTGEHPLLAKGAIAGVGDQNWVNLAGTWGNSGGPLGRCVGASAMVVGILVGNASDSNERLHALRQTFARGFEKANEIYEGVAAEIAVKKEVSADARVGAVLRLKNLSAALFTYSAGIGSSLTDLVDEHFRTGFLAFTSASDLEEGYEVRL